MYEAAATAGGDFGFLRNIDHMTSNWTENHVYWNSILVIGIFVELDARKRDFEHYRCSTS